MHEFRAYQPYVINTEILSKLNLKIKQEGNIIEHSFINPKPA